MKNTKLVYTDDPKRNQKCPKCREYLSECQCQPEVKPSAVRFTAVIRIEKTGRGGKTVTVIDKLPGNENYLKELAKKLKERCGSGGTWRREGNTGLVEIQGDQRPQVCAILGQEGIPFKGQIS